MFHHFTGGTVASRGVEGMVRDREDFRMRIRHGHWMADDAQRGKIVEVVTHKHYIREGNVGLFAMAG